MRIAVVTSDVPFVEGGHLTIARAAVRALRDCGHDADLITTPQNRFGRQFQAYWATRLTDVGLDGLGRKIDGVVSFRFPSYAVRHERHSCWLNHRLREYYDLWPMLKAQLGRRGRIKESLRRWAIHRIDARLLKRSVTRLFAQSRTIQARLIRWGRIPSEVLYPPPPQRDYRTENYEPMIFAVSRLHELKRLDLLVKAMGLVRDRGLRAVIIGDGPERDTLARLIRERELENRIALLGPAGEDAVLRAYATCRAVFFCPRQEDYGLVTVEAFASRKAVVTASDSGGPAELVRDGSTGFIAAPDPQALAEKLDILAADRALAESMGENAFRFVSKMTWDKAVEKLLEPPPLS
ncbi:MAG: glycosyltransferase family 4 protein [Candidatus Aminicenantes bacterium]|nr:glycosyltransferase family 4 protein [Candidatus Aminicenantes bacterium]